MPGSCPAARTCKARPAARPVIVIARRPPHRPAQVIRVPGSQANVIITATRTRLLLHQNYCTSGTMAWLNPVTRKLTTVIKASRGAIEVIAAIAYPGPQHSPAR